MKKLLFTSLMLVVLTSAAMAQTLTIHISGQVTNGTTQAPVVNHPVYIYTDSTVAPYLSYSFVAMTNPNGVYEANITLTSWASIMFHVYTYDCAGVIHTAQGANGNGALLTFNFVICGPAPPPCQASFNAIVSPNNSMKYYFQSTSSSSTNAYACQWFFGDGSTGNGANTYHLYLQAGTYQVCLVITSANGCQDTTCQSITVTSPPPPCSANFTFNACQNAVNCFQFHANTLTNATQYSWTFGDGSPIATTANPNHTYLQAGTYQVCLAITTANGCQDTVCHTITVVSPPPPCTAAFVAIQDSLNSNLYHFVATTSAAANSFQWGFGDGTAGNGVSVSHLYSGPGTFVVCLHVYGPNCQTVVCDTLVISGTTLPCSADFTFNACLNAVNCFQFHANTLINAAQYSWTFGDGSPVATTANPNHSYAQAGTYQVCLVIATANGCQDTVCHTITVVSPPPPCTATFVAIQDSLNSNLYHFVATSSAFANSFQWGFGDGTAGNGAIVSHLYSGPGSFVVCLHVYGPNCQTVVCDTLVISGTTLPCSADFTFNTCLNAVNCFQFHANTINSATQYFWTFGDGSPITTTANPSHNYAQTGTYQVCLAIATANGCQDTVCHTITVVSPPPPCTATFVAIQDSLNSNLYHFVATSSAVANSFQWGFGDGTGGNGASVSHLYSGPGTFVVCLHVYGPNCQAVVCDTLVISGTTPLYNIWGHVFAGSNTLLDHGKARLFKINNGANAAQLMGISPIDSNGTYHFNNIPAGTYYVKAKASPNSQYFGQYLPTYYPHNVHWYNALPIIIPAANNPYDISLKPVVTPVWGPGLIGGTITEGFKLSSSGLPAPDVDIFLKPLTGDPYIYMESDNNGDFSFSNLGYGTYEIYPEVTGLATNPAIISLNSNNPSANNVNLVITPGQVTTGITNPEENLSILNVFPNPAKDQLNITMSFNLGIDVVVSITDLPGRQVYTENRAFSKGEHAISIDLSTYENGLYMLQLQTPAGLQSRKFAVIR